MPAPGDGEGRRRALVVATGTYTDATLAGLRAPGQDAAELAAILEDAAVGGFDVETALDVPADALRRRVAHFCTQGGAGDLALVYISCHGVLDDRGRLYYATTDTDHELLAATAIPAAWLNEQLDDCRCRRQIVILDCCHSGAFAKGAKGDGALALRERFEGRGRVVLTASRATEYSFEGERVLGDGVSSVFTDVLVQGLRSGDADRDGDGMVTVTELYDYAYEAVRARDARQTPMLWTYGAEGGLLVAQSVRGAVIEPVPLSDEVMALLESARPRVRESAVAELAELLTGPDPGRALTARACLERVAAQDIPRVAALARAALEGETAAPPMVAVAAPPTVAAPPPVDPPRATAAEPPVSTPAAPPPGPPPRHRRPSLRVLLVGGALTVALSVTLFVVLHRGSDSPNSIEISGGPSGIAAGKGGMWIARHDLGTVSRTAGTSALDPNVDIGFDPTTVAADDKGAIWVSDQDGTQLAHVDAKADPARRAGSMVTQRKAQSVDLVIAFDALWVGMTSGDIVKRDLATGDQRDSMGVPEGFEGHFAAGAPGKPVLWAVGATDADGPGWVVKVDPSEEDADDPYDLDDLVHPSGVAYGADAVWIADDETNTVVRFDTGSQTPTPPIEIPDGITGDDIVAVDDAVLLWNPVEGKLTRIDPDTLEVTAIPFSGNYKTGKRNLPTSDLAVVDGEAWVTDTVGDRVFRIKY
jgi:streptogramin lyase